LRLWTANGLELGLTGVGKVSAFVFFSGVVGCILCLIGEGFEKSGIECSELEVILNLEIDMKEKSMWGRH
jgi:hypothetical protein